MKLDWTYWQVFLPIVVLLAIFSCTNPPKPEPLAPRLIVHDWSSVADLGPLVEFPLPPVEPIEKGEPK